LKRCFGNMFHIETNAAGKEADYDDEEEEENDGDEDYVPSSDDDHQMQRRKRGRNQTRDNNNRRRKPQGYCIAEESGSCKKRRKRSVGQQPSGKITNIDEIDDYGIAVARRNIMRKKSKIKSSREKSKRASVRKPMTRKVSKEETSDNPKIVTYGIRSKIRSTITNLAHPCATKRPWKWNPCNECIACLKTNNCGKCGQCIADLPCILRQCITPVRADTNKNSSFEDDNKSLSSMESNVSDLQWAEVVPKTNSGSITPKELWKTWFPIA